MARDWTRWRFSVALCMVVSLSGASVAATADETNDYTPDTASTEADAPNADAAIAAPADDAQSEVIQERYPNRTIKIERTVTQDAGGNYINHGPWKMFDERGTLVAQGTFKNGERNGVWNRWYRPREIDLLGTAPYVAFQGPFVSQGTFKDGKLNGRWTIYDSKQRKISEIEFTDGQRSGSAIWWYANGHKMRETNYKDGAIDGELIEWNQDTNAKVTKKEIYQEGRKLAPKIDYHGGTAKKSEAMFLHAKDAVQTPDDWWNGKMAVYTKQGKDEKHGAWTSWYPSGQIKLQATYKNDVPVESFTWWYGNGQKALEGSYADGKPNGKWTWWHENGQKSAQGEYASGHPTGPWSWWRNDGKVAQSADFTEPTAENAKALPTQPEVLLEKLQ